MASVAFNFVEKYAPVLAEHLVSVNATTAQNQLYGDVDLLGLNWLERTWASYYIWMGNPVLATGLLSFVLHEVSQVFHGLAGGGGLDYYAARDTGVRDGGPVGSGCSKDFSLTSQVVYFGRAIPWLIIDRMPFFRQWKLQEVSSFLFTSTRISELISRTKQ